MFGNRAKIACGLKYFWMNFLGPNTRVRVLRWLSRADGLRTTVYFNRAVSDFRRVLLILPERPFELLLVQKSIVALKQHRENMVVEVIAETGGKDIIRSNPYIDGGVFYRASEFYYNHPSFRELLYTLKGRRYDACFLFNRDKNPLHLFLMAHSGATLRVGFTDGDYSPFINLSIRPRNEAVYEGDQYESMFRTLGVKITRSRLKWNIAKNTEKDVEALLVQAGYKIERPLIGIDVSPSMNGREFPPDLLKGLIGEVTGMNNAEIILFHSRGRDGNTIKNLSFFNRNVVNIPEDKISFASAFVCRCDLIIALNNLIYQLAVMMDRPVVGLFENAEVRRWARVEEGRFESVCADKLKAIDLKEILEKAGKILAPSQPQA